MEFISMKVPSDLKRALIKRCEELGGLTITRYIINLIRKDLNSSEEKKDD